MNNIKEEHFVEVIGYEGLYKVSNYGRVKSLNFNHTKQEKILKFDKNKSGYLLVTFHKDGKVKKFSVHRLVALHFIQNDNPTEKIQVNHKDENKENNTVENLEWVTPKENLNWGTRNERSREALKKIEHDWVASFNVLNKSKKVKCTSLIDGSEKIFQSTKECGRNGFQQASVQRCCVGKQLKHKNCKFEYI